MQRCLNSSGLVAGAWKTRYRVRGSQNAPGELPRIPGVSVVLGRRAGGDDHDSDVLRQAALELGDDAFLQFPGLDDLAVAAVLQNVHDEFAIIRIGQLELE